MQPPQAHNNLLWSQEGAPRGSCPWSLRPSELVPGLARQAGDLVCLALGCWGDKQVWVLKGLRKGRGSEG